jgi:hypothetical protein
VASCALEEASSPGMIISVAHTLFVRCARPTTCGRIWRIEVAQVWIPLSTKATCGTLFTRRPTLFIGVSDSVMRHMVALNIVGLCQVQCATAMLIGQLIAMLARYLLWCGALVSQRLASAAILVGPAPAVRHSRPAKHQLEVAHTNSRVSYHAKTLAQNTAVTVPNNRHNDWDNYVAHQTIHLDHSRHPLGWLGLCSSQRPCEGSRSPPSSPSRCPTC